MADRLPQQFEELLAAESVYHAVERGETKRLLANLTKTEREALITAIPKILLAADSKPQPDGKLDVEQMMQDSHNLRRDYDLFGEFSHIFDSRRKKK
ncbi:hypothetical protein [Lacticaseibacillus thailandensis]|uniref:Uncharacterized protein n=1 Tax=Lacticaseibacillus thailandensis DSM 22698 = JCM 13996 TaxID=1423810 RepID=A0A0R2C5R8_9LACO|nr:hypothetical protein [Lacticaseibacillus thailandensis]KRM87085.1 hypothetical protein FD19_GL001236 [Lacticaseibacillus thailandensis DSM 22698 = JCM 13996]